ncbi:hypothetical protein [Vibrio marisflavi]|uniref:Tail sheath protein n=1 Tax=Vibrio marisflavi CECT 7928 TaxID=634439 RepID=A0ABM9A9P1_9VIBR|nr:hypothetical protein [Vibrio marisflavi]CAH0543042.1 hypothetical protein VMF7928_04373 [Vibrio marisflavi CECT 7928]
MNKIEFTMGNVSQTAVKEINADGTTSTDDGSNQLVFAGVIISPKGAPYEVITVTKDTWKAKLGNPYHASYGENADAMRALGEAVEGGSGQVVRVVPATATYPAIKLTKPADKVVVTNEAVNYANELSLGDGEILAIAIKDGAESDKRKISMVEADADLYGAGMFTLTLTEESDVGVVSTLDSWQVSLDPVAKDSMGAPAFIQTVLEDSDYLTCVVDSAKAQAEVTGIPETAFTGASNGSISDIKASDYDRAIEVLKTTVKPFNYVCGLACYDSTVQTQLIGIANDRRISGAFDLNPRLSHEQALTTKTGLSLSEMRANFTHVPYTATCPYFGGKAVWGASGVVFRAKATGVAKSSPIGGWQYAPAGKDRATINRVGLAPAKWAGQPDYEAMYKARINKLATGDTSNLFIDDSLTSFTTENYLRFEHVVSLMDSISRAFVNIANDLKHQPDDVTEKGLTDRMTELLESYEANKAIVAPRNPDSDGTSPWTLSVVQVSIDYWKVTWSVCPTGTARRILGEPVLIR